MYIYDIPTWYSLYCIPVTCSRPRIYGGGDVTPDTSDTDYNTSYTVSCPHGYILNNTNLTELTCPESGRFEQIPICISKPNFINTKTFNHHDGNIKRLLEFTFTSPSCYLSQTNHLERRRQR